jgi:hypothetical protein
MTWSDKREIGLKGDAPYRKDNLRKVRSAVRRQTLVSRLTYRWHAGKRTMCSSLSPSTMIKNRTTTKDHNLTTTWRARSFATARASCLR